MKKYGFPFQFYYVDTRLSTLTSYGFGFSKYGSLRYVFSSNLLNIVGLISTALIPLILNAALLVPYPYKCQQVLPSYFLAGEY